MDAVEIKMPIVLNKKHRQENFAVVGSGFSGDNLNDLVAVQELISGQRRLWRLERNSSQLYSLVGIIEEKPKTKTIPFARLNESENLSDSSILDSEFVTSQLENDVEELDDSLFYGIQVVEHSQKIIFSHEVELNLNDLEKWKPHITIDSFLLDDDE